MRPRFGVLRPSFLLVRAMWAFGACASDAHFFRANCPARVHRTLLGNEGKRLLCNRRYLCILGA